MELRNALAARFGIELPATAVFDFPTLGALSGHIWRQLAADAEPEGDVLQGGVLPGDAFHFDEQAAAATDVIGVGCLYPGASGSSAATSAVGMAAFWGAAAAGANLQRLVPAQRWDLEWCYSAGPAPGRSYARFATFVEVSSPAIQFCMVGIRRRCCVLCVLSSTAMPIPRAPPLSARRKACNTLWFHACRGWSSLMRPSSGSAGPRLRRSTRRRACCCSPARRRFRPRVSFVVLWFCGFVYETCLAMLHMGLPLRTGRAQLVPCCTDESSPSSGSPAASRTAPPPTPCPPPAQLPHPLPPAGAAFHAADLAPATGTYVGCMFWDYMSVLRVALGQKHSGPVMTGALRAQRACSARATMAKGDPSPPLLC